MFAHQIDQKFIEKLLLLDIEITNKGFSISNELGIAAMHNCVDSFRDLLVQDIGEFINGMCIEYRSYVIGLLLGVNEEYREEVTMALVFPKKCNS